MIDYDQVQINRLKDKSSLSNSNWMDRLRTTFLIRKNRILAGSNIAFKKGVQIRVCKTGKLSIGEYSFFHPNASLLLTMPHPVVEIGKWVFVGMNTIIASKNRIKIGDFTIFAPNCYVIDHEHGFSKSDVILNQKSVLKEVKIGRDCYFGAGVVILGGVTIGDGVVIGAHSVVTHDIPPHEIWAGSPARFIRKRD